MEGAWGQRRWQVTEPQDLRVPLRTLLGSGLHSGHFALKKKSHFILGQSCEAAFRHGETLSVEAECRGV